MGLSQLARSLGTMFVLAATLSACAGGAAPTAQIIYVTPAPTATPTAVPTPTPTPTMAANTMTADDQKIFSMIIDGATAVTDKLSETSNAATTAEMLDVFKALRDLASLEQTRIGIYTPSACMMAAASAYNAAMATTEAMATDFLARVAAGASGTALSGVSGATEALKALGSALLVGQASPCKHRP